MKRIHAFRVQKSNEQMPMQTMATTEKKGKKGKKREKAWKMIAKNRENAKEEQSNRMKCKIN